MKNTDILKRINNLLDNNTDVMKGKLLQLKKDLEFEIMQEDNSTKNKSLKIVAKSCMEILKVQKQRPILQKAVIRNNRLELTDSFRMVIFKNSNYITLPVHDEATTEVYPKFNIIERDARKNDITISLNITDIRNKYKVFKTLKKEDKELLKNFAYNIYTDEETNFKVYASVEYLSNMLDIFSCEENFEVKINSRSNVRPITFESENIFGLILPLRLNA